MRDGSRAGETQCSVYINLGKKVVLPMDTWKWIRRGCCIWHMGNVYCDLKFVNDESACMHIWIPSSVLYTHYMHMYLKKCDISIKVHLYITLNFF